MNINRNNYEEYFILYMDEELSKEDRLKVDFFIQQNPDLKEELDLLLLSKFSPDPNVLYRNKEGLLQEAAPSTPGISNFEEQLLLYLDNELSNEEKSEVEGFISAHPAVKKEFELLEKTKLQPEENIIFANKNSLYKKPGKVHSIQIRWWKIAAAAILILGIGTGTILILNTRKPVSGPTASREINSKNNTKERKENPGNTENLKTHTPEENISNNEFAEVETRKHLNNKAIVNSGKKEIIISKRIPDVLPAPIKNDAPVSADLITSNNLPTPIATKIPVINESTIPDINPEKTKNALTAFQPEKPPVTNAALEPYKNQVVNEQPNIEYASLSGDENKKTRGFFRKVTRLFQKATNINPVNDDDRLYIGAVAVKLK